MTEQEVAKLGEKHSVASNSKCVAVNVSYKIPEEKSVSTEEKKKNPLKSTTKKEKPKF